MIIGVILIIIGFCFLLFYLNNVSRAKQSLTWPSVKGKIIENKVYKVTGDPESDTFKLRYSYKVQGVVYISKRITNYSSENTNMKLPAKYPLSAIVDVYYEPDNPSESVLERGPESGDTTWCAMALTTLGIGAFIVLVNYLAEL